MREHNRYGKPIVHVELSTTDPEKAKSLGARVMKDVTEIPGTGSFSIITDPTGAALGLWQNA